VRGVPGGQRPRRPASRVGRQPGGLLEKGGGCGEAPSCLRPSRRALELDGDVLVGPRGGVGAVPGAAIGIDVGVGRLGQRSVRAAAIRRRRRPIDRRAHQRMSKAHARTELDQSSNFGRRRRVEIEPKCLGCAPQQRWVTDRLRRGDQ
jgi:hypothetical protein